MEMQQKLLLDHFFEETDNRWDRKSPVLLHLRRPFSTDSELRKEPKWPSRSTQWTNIYFEASNQNLSWEPAGQQKSIAVDALGEPVTFTSPPLSQETEITGLMATMLFISSSTSNADLYMTLQAFLSKSKEVDFQGSHVPHTPLAHGWLRASHREVNSTPSLPNRPYHTRHEIQRLEIGMTYKLIVEIWPTSIILRIALQISGHAFELPKGNGLAGSLGKCANLITIRIKFQPTCTFIGLLRHIKDQQVADMPYESLGF